MNKHYCEFEDNKALKIECEGDEKGGFVAWIFNPIEKEGLGIEVKYCPICGDMAPKYLRICEACGITQDETKDSFWGYWFNGRDYSMCGTCRKRLDVLIDNIKEKTIKDFVNEKKHGDQKPKP